MTWTSKYNASFTKPLVRQLMAVAQRDQRAALDAVGGAGVLPDLVDYLLALTPLRQFPGMLIAPARTRFDRQAAGSLHSTSDIIVGVGLSHQDRARVAELAQDYVRALDSVFNSLQIEDLYAPLPLTLPHLGVITTAPLAAGSVKDLWVESHAYDEIRGSKAQFHMTATLKLIVELEEI